MGAVQSFFEKQSPRVARNKRQTLSATQTSCFYFPISAHSGVFAKLHCSAKRSQFPAPTFLPSRGGQRGTPVGRQSLPQGEPFPAFSLAKTVSTSSGKAAPAEQKQTIIAYKKSEVKLQSPCGAKKQTIFAYKESEEIFSPLANQKQKTSNNPQKSKHSIKIKKSKNKKSTPASGGKGVPI